MQDFLDKFHIADLGTCGVFTMFLLPHELKHQYGSEIVTLLLDEGTSSALDKLLRR